MEDIDLPIVRISLCTYADVSHKELLSAAQKLEQQSITCLDNKKVQIRKDKPEEVEIVYSEKGFDIPETDWYDMLMLNMDDEGDLHVHTISGLDIFGKLLEHQKNSFTMSSSINISNITFYAEFNDKSEFDIRVGNPESETSSVMHTFEDETITITERSEVVRYIYTRSGGSIQPEELDAAVHSRIESGKRRLSEFKK